MSTHDPKKALGTDRGGEELHCGVAAFGRVWKNAGT